MYFWSINKLKAHLIEKPLSERPSLYYLLLTLVFYTPLTLPNQSETVTMLDYAYYNLTILLSLLGTFWTYQKNQGDKGRYFLQRYLSLAWVLGFRWLVFFLVGVAVFLLISLTATRLGYHELIDRLASLVTFEHFMLAGMLFFYPIFFWRLGQHISDVAIQAKY